VDRDITVREYARLTTASVEPDLDQAQVSASVFRWLCQYNESLKASGASALVQIESRQWLRLSNYVGVIETPGGTRIEILPKHFDAGDDIHRARQLLIRMLEGALDLPAKEVGPATLHTFKVPLREWLMGRFLLALDHLVKRGVRFVYHRIEEERHFLRGRLDLSKQIRRPPGRQHFFSLQHDIFDPDRPENRLLRSALDRVCRLTHDPGNWRIARELDAYLSPIPPSQNVDQDFRHWQHDRLMTHYTPVKPWCQLILKEQLPMTVSGEWHGLSLLYPMEKLFERYVAACLRRKLTNTATVVEQPTRRHLCRHRMSDWFELRPDLLVSRGSQDWILDTKWKRLNQALTTTKDKYEISQDDMYQMFAYGQRYLNGIGEMFLIYPKTKDFSKALPVFEFSKDLRLWAVAFDLETGAVVADGLPEDLKAVFGLGPWVETSGGSAASS
jgi:5-methylcytosine-specific restriction enzyme subunit McrC